MRRKKTVSRKPLLSLILVLALVLSLFPTVALAEHAEPRVADTAVLNTNATFDNEAAPEAKLVAEETAAPEVPAEELAEVAEIEAAPATKAAVRGDFDYDFGKVIISGEKIWEDEDDKASVRPDSITVYLKADGETVAETTATAPDWTFKFDISDGVPGTGANPVGVNFTVEEAPVPRYQYNGTKQPEVVFNMPGAGKDGWKRTTSCSSIDFNDVHDGYSIIIANKGSNYVCWSANPLSAFERELIYNSLGEGKYANYTFFSGIGERSDFGMTVDETGVYFEGKSTFSMFWIGTYDRGSADTTESTITNTLVGIGVQGAKTWDDNDDQDGMRPESITVNLLANGEVVKTITVGEADNWAWSFSDLDQYADGKEIVYTVSEEPVEGYTPSYDGMNITNKHDIIKIDIPVEKIWDDADNQDGLRPESITVALLADGKDTGKTLTLNASNSWKDSFKDLDKFAAGEEIDYEIEEIEVPGYKVEKEGSKDTGYKLTNTHEPELINIEGKKIWDDEHDHDGFRPESITVSLLANGVKIDEKTVTGSGDEWTWTFENLPKFEAGVAINYSFAETTVPGYSTEIKGYDIVNTRAIDYTSVQATKSWIDDNDRDGIRPEFVEIILLADGEPTGDTLKLSAVNNWTATFTDLPVYKNAKQIVYTIAEVAIDGYETKITGNAKDGYIVTNTHEPELINIEGTKIWNDNNNQDGKRPDSITVILLANGEKLDEQTVTGSGNEWIWSFKDLYKYENGVEITYTVAELNVPEYTTKIDGFDITNTHNPDKTQVQVIKKWEDDNNRDGFRPADITVSLLADGKDTGKTLVLSEANDWSGMFEDLDVYANGKVIAYTVTEAAVANYTTTITGSADEYYTVTNSHTPERTVVPVTKNWIDNNNQDGFRPESITVNLLANGQVIDTAVITEADGWKYTFTNLYKYEDGKLITYTVTEAPIEDYITEINGFNITNTHDIIKTGVTFNKVWMDDNNRDGIRPNDIIITLLADGKDTGKTAVLSEGNSWQGEFAGLDKYADGKEIVYTISEAAVEGYETEITADATGRSFTVTNTHEVELIDIAGTKTWEDKNNQDGFRPEFITVRLLANGEELAVKEVTEADGWAWEFTDLYKYENGVEIVYTLTEDAVEEYSAEVNGYDVTNTHTPYQTSVQVTKAWEDDNDRDGIRPDSIEVVLLANGVATDKTITLTAENNWTGTFRELDKYADGEEIVYTVEEVAVEGYNSVITGEQTEGYVITNTHNVDLIDIAGAKTWDDANDQDGKRPETITVRLLANGKEIASAVASEENNWSWSFTGLYKNEGGQPIVYAISEDVVEGYTPFYNGYSITNKYTPETTYVSVYKAWEDSNDKDNIRPGSITVKLFADGEDTGKTIKLTASSNWSGSFSDLAKFRDGGIEIVYTIEEVSVSGYETVIEQDGNKFVVTNSHTPAPKTGDDSQVHVYLTMMGVSAAALVLLFLAAPKRKKGGYQG